ncbi:MAG: polar amino acid transport system substrate-binding protein [Phenylobacterium sp.]|jgi:polar amino acid transport system substrate-binding protein
MLPKSTVALIILSRLMAPLKQCCHLLLLALLGGWSMNAASQSLRIVTEDLPPYNYRTPDGSLSGASTRIVQALLLKLDIEAQIEILPWARAYKLAMTEPNVLIFSLLRTKKRENSFHWLSAITPIKIKVFALPESQVKPFTDLNQLGHMTLGVVRNSSQVDFVRLHKNVTAKNLIFGRSFEQLYRMNVLGRVDLFMAPEMLVYYLNSKLDTQKHKRPLPVYALPSRLQRKLHLAMSKTTSIQTVRRFRLALNQMHKSGETGNILDQFQLQLKQVTKNRSVAK